MFTKFTRGGDKNGYELPNNVVKSSSLSVLLAGDWRRWLVVRTERLHTLWRSWFVTQRNVLDERTQPRPPVMHASQTTRRVTMIVCYSSSINAACSVVELRHWRKSFQAGLVDASATQGIIRTTFHARSKAALLHAVLLCVGRSSTAKHNL